MEILGFDRFVSEKMKIIPLSDEDFERIDTCIDANPSRIEQLTYTDLGKPEKSKLSKGVILRTVNKIIWIWIPVDMISGLYGASNPSNYSKKDGIVAYFNENKHGWNAVESYNDNMVMPGGNGLEEFNVEKMWMTNISLDLLDCKKVRELFKDMDYFKKMSEI